MKKIQELAQHFISLGTLIPGPNSPKHEADAFADHMLNDASAFISKKYGLNSNQFFLFVMPKKESKDPEWSYSVFFSPKDMGDVIKEDAKTLFGGGVQQAVRTYLHNRYGHLVKII